MESTDKDLLYLTDKFSDTSREIVEYVGWFVKEFHRRGKSIINPEVYDVLVEIVKAFPIETRINNFINSRKIGNIDCWNLIHKRDLNFMKSQAYLIFGVSQDNQLIEGFRKMIETKEIVQPSNLDQLWNLFGRLVMMAVCMSVIKLNRYGIEQVPRDELKQHVSLWKLEDRLRQFGVVF